jgi:hypothetical protein
VCAKELSYERLHRLHGHLFEGRDCIFAERRARQLADQREFCGMTVTRGRRRFLICFFGCLVCLIIGNSVASVSSVAADVPMLAFDA